MESDQKAICEKYGSAFVPPDPELKIGIALETLKLSPVYGTRLKKENGTTGWYIYAGENSYTEDPDFYKPVCSVLIADYCPIVEKYLGLEPGFRFIIDQNGYEDAWKDKTLLEPSASGNGGCAPVA